MCELILKDKWATLGANFGEISGSQCVKNFGDTSKELATLRTNAVFCDFSFAKKFVYDENDGLDFLDSILSADILKLRYGKIANTILADENGKVVADVFVADIDDKLIVIAEEAEKGSTSPLCSENSAATDITNSHVLLSVDGVFAWKIAKDIFGSDILNLPFLAVEKYDFEGEDVYLLRSGKTGEYGYQFLAPNSIAEKLADKIIESLNANNGMLCGFDAHQSARLEGNFFNIHAEGKNLGCPLELGLQWTIDFEKESFIGSEAIFEKRRNGVKRKLVGMKSSQEINVGEKIYDGDVCVGEIVSSAKSHIADTFLATAIFDAEYAASGFAYSRTPNGEENIETVSRPPFIALSLSTPMED